MKRSVCFILTCALMLILISCATQRNDIDDIFSQLEISDNSEIESDIAEHIYVIIPNGCSGVLSLKARELSDAIASRTGITVSLKYDSELRTAPSGALEILLGNTDRLASKNAIDVLKKGDYLCRWDNGAVVICGRSDEATVSCIEKFMSDVLPGMTNSYIMSKDACIENIAEYAVSRIYLQGYDLYDYTILFQKGNADEKRIALALRDLISERSGYFLDVESDPQNAVRRIMISSDAEDNSISADEKGIVICGKDLYSLSLLAARFANDIKSGSGDILNLNYDNKVSVPDTDASVHAVFYTVQKRDGDFTPINELLLALKSMEFDICVVGNSEQTINDMLKNTLGDCCEIRTLTVESREITLIYNTFAIRNVEAAVDNDLNTLNMTFDTLSGERMTMLYTVNTDLYAISRMALNDGNTFVFFDGYNATESTDTLSVISSGGAQGYDHTLALCENLSVEQQKLSVVNDSYRSYCKADIAVRYSRDFLNNTLK